MIIILMLRSKEIYRSHMKYYSILAIKYVCTEQVFRIH